MSARSLANVQGERAVAAALLALFQAVKGMDLGWTEPLKRLRIAQHSVYVEGKCDPACGQDKAADPEHQECRASLTRVPSYEQSRDKNAQRQHKRPPQPKHCVQVQNDLRESRDQHLPKDGRRRA